MRSMSPPQPWHSHGGMASLMRTLPFRWPVLLSGVSLSPKTNLYIGIGAKLCQTGLSAHSSVP